MYQVENSGTLLGLRRRLTVGRSAELVSRNVVMLGLVSLFTDISSEMVSTILPLYLVYTLGFTPLQYGALDGLYQGAGTLVRLGSGFLADRWRSHKQIAGIGYALSAVCKLAFPLVGSTYSALGAVIVSDRVGKGVRTAPRDALISLSSRPESLGLSFGVHRALDTAGAMIGPLVAFGFLALQPDAFNSLFVVSFCVALVGLAILVLFVENRPAPASPVEEAEPKRVSFRAAVGVLRATRFRVLAIAGVVLALATVSDGFLYLVLQHELEFDIQYFPLLAVGTAFVYMTLAVPVGRLADRIGRVRVLLGGYVLMLGVYALLLGPNPSGLVVAAFLVLLGTYYAATDGVLAAIASEHLPAELRGSGLAIVATGTTLAGLVASVAFGALWTAYGMRTAMVAFGIGMAASILVATAAFARWGRTARV
jgi:MFS family permease